MRKAFIKTLTELAGRDATIYLLAGDVGFSVIEDFAVQYGHRYFNAGVAEQNMIGVAAGLAMAGKRPVAYSIVPFVTMRCYEQVRIDVCYQELPVLVVGMGGGYSYGPMGATHHAHEDLALMSVLPGMTVVAPASVRETQMLLPQLLQLSGPAYLRLSVAPVADYPADVQVQLGKATRLTPLGGGDCVIITIGGALAHGIELLKTLQADGLTCGLVTMHTLKPLDTELLYVLAQSYRIIVTIEDHALIGGLGQAVSMALTQNGAMVSLVSFGFADVFMHQAGSRVDLERYAGLDIDLMVQQVRQRNNSLRN